jgi:hypothetical protein
VPPRGAADQAGADGTLVIERHVDKMTPAYEEWLTRVSMTYAAVVNCCRYRLGNEIEAAEVGLAVVQGLFAKPKVFKYFGLPYSGRLARLAERKIAEIRTRPVASHAFASAAPDWLSVLERLGSLSGPLQDVFTLSCVEGWEVSRVAGAMNCEAQTVTRLLDEAIAQVRRSALPVT